MDSKPGTYFPLSNHTTIDVTNVDNIFEIFPTELINPPNPNAFKTLESNVKTWQKFSKYLILTSRIPEHKKPFFHFVPLESCYTLLSILLL